MLLAEQEFAQFEDGVKFLSGLGNAINTPYLHFDKTSIENFLNSFAKIQLSRRFNPYISGIDLELNFNQSRMVLTYESTSSTIVIFTTDFDDDMQVEMCKITVHLPDERCQAGRNHYEAITHLVYEQDWLKTIRDENGYIFCKRSVKGRDRAIDENILPQPNWVLDKISNWYAQDSLTIPVDACNLLAKYNFVRVNYPFCKRAWKNYNTDEVIVENNSLSTIDNRFALITEGKERYPECWMSYRELLVLLKRKQELRKERLNFTQICFEEDYEGSYDDDLVQEEIAE